jgi:putative transposase
MLFGIKYRINPSREQREHLSTFFYAVCFVWNHFLALKEDEYKQYKELSDAEKKTFRRLSAFDMINMIPDLKREEDTKWLSKAPAQALQAMPTFLMEAYRRYFKELAEKPKFKKKRSSYHSFTTSATQTKIKNGKLHIPNLKSSIPVRIDREIPKSARIISSTISCEGNPKWIKARYFVSLKVEVPDKEHLPKTGQSVGIDVGLKDFCTLSNGKKVKRHRFEKKARGRLAHLQRIQSRKLLKARKKYAAKLLEENKPVPQKLHKLKLPSDYFTKRFERIKHRISSAYCKVSNQRRDFLNKLSTQFVREYDTIVVEDLRVRNMLKNPNLARSISDVSWSEFFRMLTYKSAWYGKTFIKVPASYTSQTCNDCGCIKKLSLKDREWVCPNCGVVHDRDINAAKNILARGIDLLSHPENILKKKPAKKLGSRFGRKKKKGNDVSVASPGDGEYTSGGLAEVRPSSERGIM